MPIRKMVAFPFHIVLDSLHARWLTHRVHIHTHTIYKCLNRICIWNHWRCKMRPAFFAIKNHFFVLRRIAPGWLCFLFFCRFSITFVISRKTSSIAFEIGNCIVHWARYEFRAIRHMPYWRYECQCSEQCRTQHLCSWKYLTPIWWQMSLRTEDEGDMPLELAEVASRKCEQEIWSFFNS